MSYRLVFSLPLPHLPLSPISLRPAGEKRVEPVAYLLSAVKRESQLLRNHTTCKCFAFR
jgi:hypothetical protein